MAYVIIALAFGDGRPCPVAGQYLEAFDFDAFNGSGFGEFTHMLEHAKKFETFPEAAAFWKTQSKVRPLRGDGKPNRPFSATTVEIRNIGGEHGDEGTNRT